MAPKSRKLRLPQLGARAKKEAAAKVEGAETRARELELQVAALQKVGLQALQASDDASSGAQLLAEATERAGRAEGEVGLLRAQLDEQTKEVEVRRAEGLATNTALADAQRKLQAAEAEAGGLRAELGGLRAAAVDLEAQLAEARNGQQAAQQAAQQVAETQAAPDEPPPPPQQQQQQAEQQVAQAEQAQQLQAAQAELAQVQQAAQQQATQLQAAQRSEQGLLTMLSRHLGRRQAHARLSLGVLRRRVALLEAANAARDGDGGARAKAARDKHAAAVAEAFFGEGKQHNTAGDFWAAREYFEHAYVAAPRNAFLLSVANTPDPPTPRRSTATPLPSSLPLLF